ncbi:DUF1214 domain-containing protein [Mycolicibacterium celeriflavum]|uniref:DUF1214 domain-containing protein n=1 Tax=Mycolicibacterium celeriflavum TaxID=1249101 RepID=A0A7I7RE42_MYCCF|nr:DUF1214 domain-containing protein [Mycolicibacterium celeriflavum]BBY42834.1 hypothetical protein MCEL_11290 [Mycolicibacterium celeriflavum]
MSGETVVTSRNPMAWLPFSVAEAAFSTNGDSDMQAAWSHLLDQLTAVGSLVASNATNGNRVDYASGMRHLLVLLAVGIDEALRADPDPLLAVSRTSTDDILTWGMECPDCIYLRATLQGGETYRLFGNRGTARYVGLQTMNGIASTANCLVDDLEVGPDGDFEVVLSADEQVGNWLRLEGENPTLVVRHFFYDWDAEEPSSLQIERIGDEINRHHRVSISDIAVAQQIRALGDFVHENVRFFLEFNAGPPRNGFMPAIDRTEIGAAAENRPVIGRYELEPDEALILEVEPPDGIYWSFSLGNQWWETIHYGRHQSSLNAHQATVDSDGLVRVVISSRDPGVANWLDTAGHSNGAMILRCVRTATAPTPATRVVKVTDVPSVLPADTAMVSAEQRAATVAARRRAVHRRFSA